LPDRIGGSGEADPPPQVIRFRQSGGLRKSLRLSRFRPIHEFQNSFAPFQLPKLKNGKFPHKRNPLQRFADHFSRNFLAFFPENPEPSELFAKKLGERLQDSTDLLAFLNRSTRRFDHQDAESSRLKLDP
jgi:hypothetical protein